MLGVEQGPESGPHQGLVVSEQDPDHWVPFTGSRAQTRKPPPGRGPAYSSPPSAATRSCMPVIPLLAGGWGPGVPATVVIDLHGEILLAVGDAHGGGGRPGMARDVGQCFLHDPVGRNVDPERQRAGRALGLRPDFQPRRRRLRDRSPSRARAGAGERGRGSPSWRRMSSAERSSRRASLLACLTAARAARAASMARLQPRRARNLDGDTTLC